MKNWLVILFTLVYTDIYAQGDAIIGVWFTEENKGMVEFFKREGKYFGKIIWLKEPNDEETGKPHVDENNPEERLQSRPIIGMEVMLDFVYDAEDEAWTDGTAYDPESGDSYSCKITMSDDNTLRVRGYIGFTLIGRTDIWKRKAF
ncbi:MAG: DUF2147 domain-containing protein [Bacteroidetes bacterium]|nr:DUF2147 domain-containing protein [Bacteroidota bacterium]MBU1718885.1 DUF2147 domain-containing protein [Bacteroidota bacterium]